MSERKKQVAEAILRKQYPFLREFKYRYRVTARGHETPLLYIDIGKPPQMLNIYDVQERVETILHKYFLLSLTVTLVPKYVRERKYPHRVYSPHL